MLPRLVSSRMMLSSGTMSIVLLSKRSPERTSVATRPAIIPFMEFDTAILPDLSGAPIMDAVAYRSWTPCHTAGNCVALSQVLHVGPERDFATHANYATLLARHYHPDRPQRRRRCHRRRRTGVDRPDHCEGQRQKGPPAGPGRRDRGGRGGN